MCGRAWYFGAIRMDFALFAPGFERGLILLDYAAGIEDTLDGGHGPGFTYLPIIYQDDCQICDGVHRLVRARRTHYTVAIEFLE